MVITVLRSTGYFSNQPQDTIKADSISSNSTRDTQDTIKADSISSNSTRDTQDTIKADSISSNSTRDTTSPSAKEDVSSIEFTGTMGSALERAKVQLYRQIKVPPMQRNIPLIHTTMDKLFQEFPPSMHLYNILLRASILLNDAERIRSTLDAIRCNSLTFNLITYNLLISYYRDQKRPKEAERLIQSMIQSGIQPDLFTYTTIISTMAGCNLERAKYYFEEARRHQLKLDAQCYNSIIYAHIEHDDLAGADALLKEMSQVANLKPNFVTHKYVLQGIIKMNKKEDAWSWYNLHLANCVEMRVGDYAEIMELMGGKGWWEETAQVANDMETTVGHLNSRAAIFMIKRAAFIKDYKLLRRLIDQYAARKPERFRMALIGILSKVQDAEVVARIQELVKVPNPFEGN